METTALELLQQFDQMGDVIIDLVLSAFKRRKQCFATRIRKA